MAMEQQNRVERRLAAILAADVAGYSRLMGLDEVGTAQVLREHRGVVDALVAKHRGRIVKTTGDALLIDPGPSRPRIGADWEAYCNGAPAPHRLRPDERRRARGPVHVLTRPAH
jgi:class 3 adenylate cyclase